MDQRLIILNNEADTLRVAADLAVAAKPGDLITLKGELGAGKTAFAREFIRRYLDIPQLEIPSPTYLLSLDHENSAGLVVTHMDLYRISHPGEIDELGLDEALQHGVVIIEWPQNADDTLPPVNLALTIDITGHDTRELTLKQSPGSKSTYLRSLEIGNFLHLNWPGEITRKPFATDASARNYELIKNQNDTRLLMDAPRASDGPVIDQGKPYSQIANLAEEVKPFVAIAGLLRNKGINAPEIYASDMENGLVLLEHLGEGKITDNNNVPIPDRYLDAARLLATIHETSWPCTISLSDTKPYTIPAFDPSVMMIEVQLLTDWYLRADSNNSTGKADISEFKDIWSNFSQLAQGFEKSIVLRDYHSPNIIWSPGNTLKERIGVIDFQDALIGPAAYDLVSLAQDARVVVTPELETQIIQHYISTRQSQNSKFSAESFLFEYALMGAQRTSKLLGIFVRLNLRDDKPQFLALLPTIRDYLRRNLQHPDLSACRKWYERVIGL